jgi:hypothetical protein
MFRSVSLLFFYISSHLSSFLHLFHLLYFFSSAIFIVRYLFFLIVSCLLFLCLSAGIILVSYWAVAAPLNFLHQERRCSICGPCRSLCAVQRCIASPGWVLVLISGITEHHWHMRCALQVCWLQRGCVRACLFVCLSVGMLLLLERRGVAFVKWDLKLRVQQVSAKGQNAELRTP